MTIWTPDLSARGGPRYLAIADALAADTLRDRVREPRFLRALNRIGGSVLIGAGIATATLRRSG